MDTDQPAAGGRTKTTVNGAELMRRALLREGVEVMFGHPGGAILPFYDTLHGAALPRHVLVRHEQAAAHAADGYARATGRTGVCVATSGPGATNLVTGLATALSDSVPVVALTGQVPLPVLGSEAFQETDILGITMPVTKHGFLVERAADLPRVVEEAFRIARSGRPGPVLVDVPKDVQAAEVPASTLAAFGRWVERRRGEAGGPGATTRLDRDGAFGALRTPDRRPDLPAGEGHRAPSPGAALETALALLAGAERPVMLVGRGVVLSGTRGLVVRLAETGDLPVITTLLGLDGFPQDHPLCLGMPGMHGTERANRAIQASDLVLGLGVRFDDRVTGRLADFAPDARIVQLDVDPSAAGRTVPVDLALVGDLRETLPPLVSRAPRAERGRWWEALREWSRDAEPDEDPCSPADGEAGTLSGRAAVRRLARWIGARGAVVATDVGQHQMWFAQEVREAEPGTHLTSGGLGTMGYALPAALGAAVALPGREVWAVTGDGGFQMTLQELATLAQERIPLRVAVVNNQSLGMVRQWQEIVYGGRYVASALSGPDFAMLARAFGIDGRRITTPQELDDALAATRGIDAPVLLDIQVPASDNVYPMLPPGSALHELLHAPRPAAASA